MSVAEQYVAPACWIRPAMPGDTWLMLPTVRQADIDELAAIDVTPEYCIRYGMKYSRQSFTAFFHGEPGAIFGCVEHPSHGIPWAVFTTAIDRFPLPFLRASKRYIDTLPMRLENYVDARNQLTIQWLSWLGFTIEAPQPAGIHGEPFSRFSRCAIGG